MPKVITEKIEINDIELRDLDMTVPIYLAQYGRYYAIISIKAEDTEYVNVNCYNWRYNYERQYK